MPLDIILGLTVAVLLLAYLLKALLRPESF
ncbi:K(+)-transporting ATPase subunit F [Bosea sp. RAC05]|jgi:K+-transporting ATPase KdpF subunit|nr:K(+)-transporting ATPase subunit F [Bosea sp. RAC05]AOG03579.1 K+-transporting ATPase, F subunit [Bosea sp. RAC05]